MEIMKTMIFCSVAATFAVALSGCATTAKDCDPASGGYLRGIGCSASGAYEQRQYEKSTTLQEERARQYQLQNDYSQTVAEQQSVRAQRRGTEKQYASLHSDLNRMRSRLAKSKSGGSNLNREISDLQSEVSMLEQDTFTPEAEKTERLDRLIREKAALEREIDMALQR